MYSQYENKLFFGSLESWQEFKHISGGRTLRRRKFAKIENECLRLPDDCRFVTVDPYDDIDPHRVMREQSDVIISRLEGENPISTEAWFEEEFNKNKSVWAELEGLHHTDHIAEAIQNGTACAVSDGSYFDKFGTSASVICNRQEKEIWARSITPGPAAAQNPHRSELAGVVCSLTIIAAICSAYQIQEGSVTVCLDGDQAIKNIQRGYVRSYFADYDILTQIHSILNRLPVSIKWKWVRGHQDDYIHFDQLEYEAQQNVRVDQAAKEFLHLHMNETVPSRTFTFPAEKFWLVYEGNKFTQIKSADLYHKMASADILDSWSKSAGCDRGLVDEWDWEAYAAAATRATYAERRKLLKLSSGFAPVGYMMMKWQKQDHDRCPCCDAESETVHHMVTCPAPKMKQKWKDALVEFKADLEKCQTRPQIINEVIRQLRAWRLAPNSPPLPTNSSISWQLDRCITHQHQIGWRNFIFGRISPLWTQYQRTFLQEQNSKITPET